MLLLAKLGRVIIGIKRELNLVLSQKVTLMTIQNCITSACRYCRFYTPEGLHGGACQQLSVSVRSDWKACQLGLPAFANTWENAEQLAVANRQPLPRFVQPKELANAVAAELNLPALSVNNN
jgi:hypothetical protein